MLIGQEQPAQTTLALLGFATVTVLLLVIMTKRMTPLVALILIPVAAALLGGFGFETGAFITAGIRNLAPVVAMFVFAILFFGLVSDAGMFDPIIDRVLKAVGTHPRWVVPGSALLAMLLHLDGSGATTFLIVVPAMLPLYERLAMRRQVLACVVAMGAGVMNLLPWGGPTLRAAAALQMPSAEIFNPMIPAQLAGVAFVLAAAYVLGRREEKRLSWTTEKSGGEVYAREVASDAQELRRPRLFWVNILLTVVVLGVLVAGWMPPAVMFMLGTALALMINYPDLSIQRQRVDAHARAALMMASILLAAGVFTGVLQESGMLTAMAGSAVALVPPELARHIPVTLGLIAMPLSLLFDPDSFYFGVLPVVAEVSQMLGVEPVSVARGALLGQMTTGFAVSPLTPATFLLVGLTRVDLADHQKFTIPFLWATSVVMTIASVLFRVIPV
jgi:citrate-Mg2+:H+ or citrate-Ca2+:H+ symporter, CitMHS family